MVADSETGDNPYDSPRLHGPPSGRFIIVRWLLLVIAVLLIFLSLPVAWHTLELANQEYLHLWNSRRAIYDIEINETPVSIGTAILYGAITVLIHWTLAAGLIIVPRFFAKNVQRNNS